MATQTLSLGQPVGNRSVVLWTLARQRAIKTVKAELQAQGARLPYIPIRDIRALADAYLAEHRQALIEEAMEIVRKAPELRTLYEREQAKLRKNQQCQTLHQS